MVRMCSRLTLHHTGRLLQIMPLPKDVGQTFVSQAESTARNTLSWAVGCNCSAVLLDSGPQLPTPFPPVPLCLAELFIPFTNICTPVAPWPMAHSVPAHRGANVKGLSALLSAATLVPLVLFLLNRLDLWVLGSAHSWLLWCAILVVLKLRFTSQHNSQKYWLPSLVKELPP